MKLKLSVWGNGFAVQIDGGEAIGTSKTNDYPRLATAFGWDKKAVKGSFTGCAHTTTDGSAMCRTCCATSAAFEKSAGEFLAANVGKEVDVSPETSLV
jgi:hypothetical protein